MNTLEVKNTMKMITAKAIANAYPKQYPTMHSVSLSSRVRAINRVGLMFGKIMSAASTNKRDGSPKISSTKSGVCGYWTVRWGWF
jgi:hypothetical protein